MKNLLLLCTVFGMLGCRPPEEYRAITLSLEEMSDCDDDKKRGPDYCSNRPNASHCHVDMANHPGFCHQGRCLEDEGNMDDHCSGGMDAGTMEEPDAEDDSPVDSGTVVESDATVAPPDAPVDEEPQPGAAGGSGNTPVGQGDRGRVGFQACNSVPGSTSTGFFVPLLLLLLLIGVSRLRKYRGLLVMASLFIPSISYADQTGKAHLSLDFMYQLAPSDRDANGTTHQGRMGVEVDLVGTLNKNLDLGGGLVMGSEPGFRLIADLHPKRLSSVNGGFIPFAQLRGIVHPAGNDPGLGVGLFTGFTKEAGPGRFRFGPAVEVYTAPDSNLFRNYAFLGMVGYQFDSRDKTIAPSTETTVKPVIEWPEPAPQPVPTPPSTENQVEGIDGVIYFDLDSAVLSVENMQLLDIAAWLMLHADGLNTAKIHLSGHACTLGAKKYNQKLSKKRAMVVKDYLVSKGISKRRIKTKWHGSAMPADPMKLELNRRVEILIK